MSCLILPIEVSKFSHKDSCREGINQSQQNKKNQHLFMFVSTIPFSMMMISPVGFSLVRKYSKWIKGSQSEECVNCYIRKNYYATPKHSNFGLLNIYDLFLSQQYQKTVVFFHFYNLFGGCALKPISYIYCYIVTWIVDACMPFGGGCAKLFLMFKSHLLADITPWRLHCVLDWYSSYNSLLCVIIGSQ